MKGLLAEVGITIALIVWHILEPDAVIGLLAPPILAAVRVGRDVLAPLRAVLAILVIVLMELARATSWDSEMLIMIYLPITSAIASLAIISMLDHRREERPKGRYLIYIIAFLGVLPAAAFGLFDLFLRWDSLGGNAMILFIPYNLSVVASAFGYPGKIDAGGTGGAARERPAGRRAWTGKGRPAGRGPGRAVKKQSARVREES